MNVRRYFSALPNKVKDSFYRFYPAILLVVGATILAIIEVYSRGVMSSSVRNMLLVLYPASVVALISVISAESARFSGWRRYAAHLWTFPAVLVIYLIMPDRLMQSWIVQYVAVQITIFLALIAVPFLFSREHERFVAYLYTIFIRLLLSYVVATLFTSVVVGALLSIAALFDISHSFEKLISSLYILSSGLFFIWLFASGLPDLGDKTKLDKSPAFFHIIARWVLIPISIIYMLILYAYIVKVVFITNIPKGWVSYLIVAFSGVGVVTWILIFPKSKKDGRLILWFRHYFPVMLFFVQPLLWYAVYIRVSEYGVTELRAVLIAIAVWIALFIGLTLVKRRNSIIYLFSSLFIITLFLSVGPLSIVSLSLRSQHSRLSEIMIKYNMLDSSGHLQKAEKKLSFKDKKNFSSLVRYLYQHHGEQPFEEYFETVPCKEENKDVRGSLFYRYTPCNFVLEVTKIADIDKVEEWQKDEKSLNKDSLYLSVSVKRNENYLIAQEVISLFLLSCRSHAIHNHIQTEKFDIKWEKKCTSFNIKMKGGPQQTFSVQNDIVQHLIKDKKTDNTLPPEKLKIVKGFGDEYEITFLITDLHAQMGEKGDVNSISMVVSIKEALEQHEK